MDNDTQDSFENEFNLQIQKKFISLLVFDKAWAEINGLDIVKPELFENNILKNICSWIHKHYKKYKTYPTRMILAKEAEDYAEAALWFNAALNCADHSREGDFERAEERGLFPYIELSCCLWRLNRREEAFEMHKKAAALAPDHPSVKYNEKFFSEYFGNLKK